MTPDKKDWAPAFAGEQGKVPTERIATLDILRGVAVMGILLANLPAFALPHPAYFAPRAWGGNAPADLVTWFGTFVLVEGKMRGLFSLLFGASMLLVIERSEAKGESGALIHFRRMAALFLFGCAHRYLIWWGDILAHYALAGCVAFLFWRLSARYLVLAGLGFLTLTLVQNIDSWQLLRWAAERSTQQQIETWDSFAWFFGLPPAEWTQGEVERLRGPWAGQIDWRWQYLDSEWSFFRAVGPETLSAMLFGMAGLRSGFLTGAWSAAAYRRVALLALGCSLAAYALLGARSLADGFEQRALFFNSQVATVPFRLLGAIGYAALIIQLTRRGGGLVKRIAAAGRAAFTNYLGTSLLMTAVFYGWGLGLFGKLHRAELLPFALVAWAVMLLWSKPWLERFRYGPFEWIWRSLTYWRLEPLRR